MNTFLWNWTQHPSSSAARDGYCLKTSLSGKLVCFLCLRQSVQMLHQNILLAEQLFLIECIIWSMFFTPTFKLAAGIESKATPMGVPAPLGLFLSRKERWWVGVEGGGGRGGRFWAKQTVRVSTLKVNITLCLNYTPPALQFSHTPALSSLSLILANTPSSRAQLNTLLIPRPSNKLEEKQLWQGLTSTANSPSPVTPTNMFGKLWNKRSNDYSDWISTKP